jgi:GNAT superfamily N-acetyltransferase
MSKSPNGNETDSARPTLIYLCDDLVDARLDAEIRELLCCCFTAPEHARFKTQRYFYGPYPHRLLLRSADGGLIGHLGIHERVLRSGELRFLCGGIADVCIHPAHRGRGLMKRLLNEAHDWMRARGCSFSVLFGDSAIYRSSGYRPVQLFLESPTPNLPQPLPALACALGAAAWPEPTPCLEGALF